MYLRNLAPNEGIRTPPSSIKHPHNVPKSIPIKGKLAILISEKATSYIYLFKLLYQLIWPDMVATTSQTLGAHKSVVTYISNQCKK
jgi:hypothetical protein